MEVWGAGGGQSHTAEVGAMGDRLRSIGGKNCLSGRDDVMDSHICSGAIKKTVDVTFELLMKLVTG